MVTISAPPSEGQTARIDTVNTYFLNGWIKTSTDPWGIRSEFDYDDLGQQTSRKLSGPGGATREQTWTYFPDGKKKTQSDNGAGTGSPRTSFTDSYDPHATLTEMRDEQVAPRNELKADNDLVNGRPREGDAHQRRILLVS